ncbi:MULTISPECIES: stimulus-sensing domain-containing protein [unclassified Chelatococcus]|jgi:two-component system sensor histidine kinase ChvG|uniref:stimulus-sensing domain-containing protein n=1 Tax=unclassified Chelatococcus TaxID=2638111 RepID=UPI001BCCCB70|nr:MULTISPECIES: stimulus-sensing domain-containing protein [unclassified Chelatococcus]MBS7740589.1 stimulus-sensing domain-containing protein [Chelatococcus sp. HY11]MBX3544627.1 stimulus-sensing domain-containing protein [Chelatococcus sp.]CAH1656812.1 Sensor protein ChvG [Hyphomicrobiales bacterium]CAH1684622.1 Sensor protein ChvG [Hyphomicrobiales bacterium]
MAVEPIDRLERPHPSGTRRFLSGVARALRRGAAGLASRSASSLTRRIVVLNLAGLVALLLGFLYLNQFRAGLIDARVQSLLTQGEIIAAAVAASATVETDTLTLDPDKLLQLQAGESFGMNDELSPLEFSINPERVAPVLRRLVTPTRTRARIYDRDGLLLLDSRSLYSRGDILRYDLPPLVENKPPLLERVWQGFWKLLGRGTSPLIDELAPINGRSLPEVQQALIGTPGTVVRVNNRGQTIVSVAVPIQRFRTVRGALLLSTQGGDIDAIISAERWAILRVFAVSAGVMTILSVLLAGTIAGPVRRLADAAERVRRGIKSRQEIPDFTDRSDEIGHLSGALRDMTRALYNRIDAIESFAADVAHELKNPLTSLRSAVETLPLAKRADARNRLLEVIQQDVRRLDRLISDISDASRLDAELARAEAEPVDLERLVQTVASVANELKPAGSVPIKVTVNKSALGNSAFFVVGNDGRLGQVVRNLIDNAASFSPPDAEIRVALQRLPQEVEIVVEDDGPGIPPHALERIFERFYTDRPEQGFGQNSGLGLSISRQIVEAHRGRIWAENRFAETPAGEQSGQVAECDRPRLGARFIVRLPAAAATSSS